MSHGRSLENLLRFLPLIMLTLSALNVAVVAGQEIPTIPTPADPAPVGIPQATKADLRGASANFIGGHWKQFSADATTLLKKIPGNRIDLRRDYVLLVWADTPPTAEDPVLLSAILHEPSGEPYSHVIPGLVGSNRPKLIEVFVTDNPKPSIESRYVSKPLPHPLLTQVPDVVDKFLGPLFTRLAANAPLGLTATPPPPPKLANEPPPPDLWTLVRDVELPEARAGVEAKISVSLPVSATRTLADMEADLRQRGHAITSAQGDALGAAVLLMQGAVERRECEGPPRACRTTLHTAVTDALAPRVNNPRNDGQRQDLRSLEAALHAAVDGFKPNVVSGDVALENSPLMHLGFGLLSAFMARSSGDSQRAKVDTNKIAADPLPRALQLVVLNWSPWGYQEKTMRRWSPRAFVRPFAGVVFSPDIGIGTGVSLMVLSNLGVNVGYARLFISTPEEGLQIGADLSERVTEGGPFKYSDDLRRGPLKAGRLDAVFLGVSYNFK
jgi:hypothetical protein